MRRFCYICLFIPSFWISAQETKDTSIVFNKKRTVITSSSIGLTWTGSMVGLYQLWYKDEAKSSFTFEDDADLWLQMDKAGHAYTSWMIGQFVGKLYRACGIDNKKSAWLGGSIGLGFQTTLEIFDGFSQGYGFSWSDMSANVAGSVLYTSQQLAFGDQLIKLKFSYSPSPYSIYRPEVLGSTHLERLFKDYNGQTYWLSFSPGTFLPNSKIPKWLCLSVGYSADQKLKGDQTYYSFVDESGTSSTFQARRELLVSLDLDLSKIPARKVWVKKTLEQINLIKIPFPTLRFSNGITYGHLLYF